MDEIAGVELIELDAHRDNRGYFCRIFENALIEKRYCKIVQTNIAQNTRKWTWRGLHYQDEPSVENKFICCISGQIEDFLVDLRHGSETFGTVKQISMRANKPSVLYVPSGVAHGYLTTENDTTLLYGHTDFHNPKLDRGISHKSIQTHIDGIGPILVISEKDKHLPLLQDLR